MKRPTEKKIISFYKSDEFEPEPPLSLNWRHFRFKLYDGCWKKVPYRITTVEALKKWIIKLKGCDIYYSTSMWLNPHRISSKGKSGTYEVADNLLLGNDLVFDIDAPEPICIETLEEARKATLAVYDEMVRHKEYEFEYVGFTGHKGFRLAYTDLRDLPAAPRKRIGIVEKDRKIFIDSLVSNIKETGCSVNLCAGGTFFDEKITTNVMCVVRVLGTIHSTTGYISSKVTMELMKKSIPEILNHIPYVGAKRPGIPVKRKMTEAVDVKHPPHPRLLANKKDASGLASFLLEKRGEKYFLSNKVYGRGKMYVPVFIYQKIQKYWREEVIKLQKEHRLGPLYVFEDGNKIIILSLKVMQRRQLMKLLNKSKSFSRGHFRDHFQIFIPVFTKFVEKIDGILTGQQSKVHYIFAEKQSAPEKGLVGEGKARIIKGIVGE